MPDSTTAPGAETNATNTSQTAALPQMDDAVLASVAFCRQIARTQAKNFYHGMRLTPEPRRSAMYTVYAFMRTCDDLADEVAEPDPAKPSAKPHDPDTAKRRMAQIEHFRALMVEILNTGRLPQEAIDDPSRSIWPAFLWAVRAYRIDVKHLHEMLDGQRADLVQTRYNTFTELAQYCHNVAGVVGLVCVRVWGAADKPQVRQLAEYRGLALQLTNILRDLVEDAQRDRVYLPKEELERFHYTPAMLRAGEANTSFDRLMQFQIERARSYYDMSTSLETLIDPSCRATSWVIMKIYRDLLEKIAQDPRAVLRGRVRLTGFGKAAIAARGLIRQGFRLDDDVAKRHVPARWTYQPNPRVLVAGGGLAGIAAAVRLAQNHVPVTLVETRKRLGGRATSFADPQTGRTLDNCQHVLMGCCTNLLDLYGHLGVRDRIEWHRRFFFASPDGTLDTLEADDLPAPMHMTQSILRFKGLTWGEKIAIARGMFAIMRTGVQGRVALRNVSFAQWLAREHQPEGAIKKFWEVTIVSALNESLENASAAYAMQVFQEGFLANEEAYMMGLSSVPLVELYDRAEQTIQAAGGSVMLGTSIEQIVFDGERVTGLLIDGDRTLSGDAVIAALPFDRLAKVCSPSMARVDARLRRLEEIQVSPILGIHLWFAPRADGSPMFSLPHLVLPHAAVQWIFNKGMDAQVGGQHLHGVISAAHQWVDVPAEKIIEAVAESIRQSLPEAQGATLIHGRVVKEKRATFSPRPGIDELRPGPRGEIENLYLSGDWCDSGWPATMEGAVRTGYRAAAAVLEDFRGRPETALIEDLPATTLYRMIAG